LNKLVEDAMAYDVLNDYLARLSRAAPGAGPGSGADADATHGGASRSATSVWLDADGKAQGRFFNCTMTSAFQAVRRLDSGAAVAFEGLARSAGPGDQGLSLWKLLDHAASDDESIALDRLCRMLHSINFFRQAQASGGGAGPDLYLNVHDRLLSAVSSNHGHAFQRILNALGLPIGRIVLQLPAVTPNQGWLLNYVADNYRRNGFRLAVNCASPHEAIGLLDRLHPDVFKLDARDLGDGAAAAELLAICAAAGIRVVFKRLDTPRALATLHSIAATGQAVFVQGYLFDHPSALLATAPKTIMAETAVAA
jgi:EAL domain-containing protein (putative c-di-GMP-specific phosphodiesterase class I)